MIAVYLAPVYLLVNLYVLRWLFRWLGACHERLGRPWARGTAALVYAFFAAAVLIGFLMPAGRAARAVRRIGNWWLGAALYLILTVAFADALRLLLRCCPWVSRELLSSRRTFVLAGAVCILVTAGVSIYGIIQAGILHTSRYEITVEKDGGALDDLQVVLAADLHLGYNTGCGRMAEMVRRINEEHPDLVVIAGDIFDNSYEALDDPERLASILRGIQSRYGVYACYGNHDVEEKVLAGFTFGGGREKASDPRMDAFLEQAGIRLLREEYTLIADSVYLYGRPDASRPGRGIAVRKTPEECMAELDRSKPVLVLDHEPRELQELADAGADVDLCGHTHDGQMFPANLICRLAWENARGCLKKGGMYNIVTSGVGVFGPNMRVGTQAEICSITIHFQGPETAL